MSSCSPGRPQEDLARDPTEKAAEVLQFFSVKPGMLVLDLNAATGYYTELLARAVGPQGHVIAHNHPGAEAMLGDALQRRYRDHRLSNVETLQARHNDLHLAPQNLDFVLMSMVYHDTYWQSPGVDWGPVDRQAMLRTLYEALKPGGVIGVIDHAANEGRDPRITATALHRIDPQIVRRDFLRAGFVLDAESNLLCNANDAHQRGVFDPAIQGHTDRFVMRFVQPAR